MVQCTLILNCLINGHKMLFSFDSILHNKTKKSHHFQIKNHRKNKNKTQKEISCGAKWIITIDFICLLEFGIQMFSQCLCFRAHKAFINQWHIGIRVHLIADNCLFDCVVIKFFHFAWSTHYLSICIYSFSFVGGLTGFIFLLCIGRITTTSLQRVEWTFARTHFAKRKRTHALTHTTKRANEKWFENKLQNNHFELNKEINNGKRGLMKGKHQEKAI